MENGQKISFDTRDVLWNFFGYHYYGIACRHIGQEFRPKNIAQNPSDLIPDHRFGRELCGHNETEPGLCSGSREGFYKQKGAVYGFSFFEDCIEILLVF